MNDRSSETVNYTELKFSREQGFFDKSKIIRFLIGLGFMLCLFLILHFREIRIQIFEFDSTAPNYVVALVDFGFLDEESMTILREETVRDIGKIYKLSDMEIQNRRVEFENFLIYNQDWRKYASEGTFNRLYQSIDSLENVLKELRLTDPRTLNKVREAHLSTEYYFTYTPTELKESILLPEQLWKNIESLAFPKGTYKETADIVIGYLQQKMWLVEEDEVTEYQLRQRMRSFITDKYTHVRAGTRIIEQGERVTTRHIAMLQAMKKAVNEERNLLHLTTLLGSLCMAILLTAICVTYFRIHHRQILESNRKLFLLLTIIALTCGIAKSFEYFLLNSQGSLVESVHYPLIVPFAAILMCSLINSHIATFGCGFLTIIFGMTLVFENQAFMLINLATSLVIILSTCSLRRRKEVFVVCGKAWLCSIVVVISLYLYQGEIWSIGIIIDIMITAIFMLLTAIIVVGLLPLLESIFRIMTDVTLMEYMDPNNDLLRRLTIEAPGTYQHSVVVGNLTEAAALSIGANGLFCRVSTLYHDIGKMITPQYFTENQQGGVNIHQLLTPQESAKVIIAHVSEGVSLARRAGLPEQFIDIIREHHGTTLVYYFYRKQLDKMGGDKSLVDEREFRYPGPKPRSKESAIIMIADSLEAASRSLEKVNEETLMELADRLIREKASDGQFDHCLLTCEELAIVKNVLVKTLVAYGHGRVKYPLRSTEKNTEQVTIIDA